MSPILWRRLSVDQSGIQAHRQSKGRDERARHDYKRDSLAAKVKALNSQDGHLNEQSSGQHSRPDGHRHRSDLWTFSFGTRVCP